MCSGVPEDECILVMRGTSAACHKAGGCMHGVAAARCLHPRTIPAPSTVCSPLSSYFMGRSLSPEAHPTINLLSRPLSLTSASDTLIVS